MAEAFIVRRGGGGGSGGTLVVTSSGAGTVTVSNTALGKSYSKTVAAGGSVTFKGLKTGEWTVTLSNGTQTTTRSVTINADYSVSVAYFSATISITYPAASTCVVTNSGGQTVASDTNTGTSTKTWTATVGATGTYTVTATATDGSGKSKSQSVSITADGQSESVTLSYELYIFKAGTGSNTTWTTGAGTYGTSWNTSGTDYLRQTIGGFNEYVTLAYLYADSAFDVTNYTTLVVTGYGNCDGQSFGVSSSPGSPFTASGVLYTSSSETIYTVDITGISGNAYFVIPSKGSYITNTQFTITNIYFK